MLRKLFYPPIFEDQEQTYLAGQLWWVVIVMLIATTAYLIAWVLIVPEKSTRIVLALPLYPLFAVGLYLIYKGKLKITSALVVGGIWLVLFTATALSGGVLAPGYSGLFITILAAGIFMGRNWAIVFAILSVVSGGVLIYFDNQGMLTSASIYTDPITMWIAQSVYFFIAVALLNSATLTISNALLRAKHELEERQNAEKQLREAELLYRTLVEDTSVVTYRDAAAEGAPSMFISKQIEKMLGYTPEEFSGTPDFWLTLLHPDDVDGVLESIRDTLANGNGMTHEYRLKSKNGEWVWIRDEFALIKDENEKPLFIQGVF
ncbi:MAG: PAS domain-containing protein [Anaerolineales bacterium]|nr:PAS domain-containing protein [Anaerolineales bacterium]